MDFQRPKIWMGIDPSIKRFKRTLINFNTDTQHANIWGNPLYQATKRHLNSSPSVSEFWMGKGRLSQTPDGTWHSNNILSRSRVTMTEQKDNDTGNEEKKQKKNAPASLLGDSGGVDFCPALLKSLGCFYFRCVLSSQWKAVTVNLQTLHCQP